MMSFEPCRDRSAVRHTAPIPCQVVTAEDFRLLGTGVLDLSENGALVASDGSAKLGDAVVISFRVPGSKVVVDAEARVARVVRGLRDSDLGPALGLEFTRIDEWDRAILKASLAQLPATTPQRNERRDYAAAIRKVASESMRAA